MPRYLIIFCFSSLLILCSCAKGISQRNEGEAVVIELPAIPDNLRTPGERADYLTVHYWDMLDFAKAREAVDKDVMEQSYVNFLSVLPYVTSDTVAVEGFRIMLDKSSVNPVSYRMLANFSEDYLYDPNSPMYSEELYIIYLTALSRQNQISEANKVRILDRIEMVGKNREGTVAADFSYKMADGTTSSLFKSLPVSGNKLMLVFFDPDCEHCDEVISRMISSDEINTGMNTGEIKILAIYAGENRDAWERKLPFLPAEWTIGINENEIEEEELYFLPSMPTIYLLDSDGKVLRKNILF